MKKIIAAAVAICLITAFTGCQKNDWSVNSSESEVSSESKPVAVTYLNPLTGEKTDKDIASMRPVAVMVNNISTAQKVQTGLNSADIVYETEVEGGITRLMAVFQNIAEASKIGTIRSARYPYVDLAMGHNAIYIHCGQDNTYCGPHLKDIDDISIDSGKYGERVSNGLAKEHTLYTNGEMLSEGIAASKFKTTKSNNSAWQIFSDDSAPVVPDGGVCNSVSVPFSQSYNTEFQYNTDTGMYTRLFNSSVRKDYVTGEDINVKNVFVLMTTIRDYSDGYHREVLLSSGSGYYIVNGAYMPIKWSKGSATSSFVFTKEDGTPLTVSPGTSWVCIANSSTSQPVIS